MMIFCEIPTQSNSADVPTPNRLVSSVKFWNSEIDE